MKRARSLTRRQFVGQISLAAPALYALPGLTLARVARRESPIDVGAAAFVALPAAAPVVSFHIDQTYLDKSGTATPYVPPAGTRSGQAVSELSDTEYLSRYMYF